MTNKKEIISKWIIKKGYYHTVDEDELEELIIESRQQDQEAIIEWAKKKEKKVAYLDIQKTMTLSQQDDKNIGYNQFRQELLDFLSTNKSAD